MRAGETEHDVERLIERVEGSPFAHSLAEFAVSFLCWDGRRTRMTPDLTPVKRSAWTRESLKELGRGFVTHFMAAHGDWALEDVERTWSLCLEHCNSFVDWFALVVGCRSLAVRFQGDEPQVPVAGAAAWHWLSDKLDADSMVAFLFAAAGMDDRTLDDWPLITRIGEPDLDVVLARGISDLHVHLGGMRSPLILWRRILHDPGKLDVVRRYARSRLINALPYERELLLAERKSIELIAGKHLVSKDAQLHALWNPEPKTREKLSEQIFSEARAERRLLIAAWRKLIDARGRGTKSVDLYALELELDWYIVTKSVFLSHHRQPQDANPGLAEFRGFFHSTDLEEPRGRHRSTRFAPNRHDGLRALSEYAAHVAQSSSLKRLELRLAPIGPHPYAYHRFFELWRAVETDFDLARGGREIKFAVHFKRSLPAGGGAGRLQRFLIGLDRDSAALHSYRRCPDRHWNKQGHIDRIARIDFAGQERDLPVHLSAFCMNLLREDEVSLRLLAESDVDPVLHRFWLLHSRRRTTRQLAGRQRLGITCHAGEDYAHPLEGIYAVASAVELLKLGAGDTIGHGLALGSDLDEFNIRLAPARLTTRGSQFDALLWLMFHLEEHERDMSGSLLTQLRAWLVDEAKIVYGRFASGLSVPDELSRLFSARAGPLRQPFPKRADIATRLHQAECKDAGCADRRAEAVPVDKIVLEASAAIGRTQLRLLSELAGKGIILEFNPSSNMRVSGSRHIADTPFVAIVKLLRTQCLATLNTDNPGVFASRIENEYALLVQALEDAGFTRAERLETAERIRQIGMDFVWWPKRTLQRQVGKG
jgi:hypothetical protein